MQNSTAESALMLLLGYVLTIKYALVIKRNLSLIIVQSGKRSLTSSKESSLVWLTKSSIYCCVGRVISPHIEKFRRSCF